MRLSQVDFAKTSQFSSLFLDYLKGESQLDRFYGEKPVIDNFEKQISNKNFDADKRTKLVSVLKEQYQHLNPSPEFTAQMELLAESNTFTITTGHQLNLFTGPLYFIYKIVTVINIARELKEKYPQYNFVPVYWMATEDHDFDEIDHFRLNGKKYQWQTEQKGGVGRFSVESISSLVESIPGVPEFFKQAYLKETNLANAVRSYVHHLFSEYGLVVVDGDNTVLKKELTNVIKEDLINHTAECVVGDQSKALNDLGYKTQVFARDINFFYLKDGLRERLIQEGNKYVVLDTDISFSEDELLEELEEHPECFSPNVILRPLYQEVILPNLAYIGGPAEVAYWLQLKPIFDHHHVAFPVVMPRNFAMVIPHHIDRKMDKCQITIDDVFKPKDLLAKELVKVYSAKNLQVNGKYEKMMALYEELKVQAEDIDPTLVQHVDAQQTKAGKVLENIEKKFIRAEKKKQADRLGQVDALYDFLRPNGGWQERTDNFLNFYLEDGLFIHELVANFKPFDYRFNVLTYDR